MKSKTKKIIVGMLAIVIGVPVALLLTAFIWTRPMGPSFRRV
jgi:uncharacterized membrane protein